MGPGNYLLNCGPEGIRTPDLLSAIEARSQLRYRPVFKATAILPEGHGNVNVHLVQSQRIPHLLYDHIAVKIYLAAE